MGEFACKLCELWGLTPPVSKPSQLYSDILLSVHLPVTIDNLPMSETNAREARWGPRFGQIWVQMDCQQLAEIFGGRSCFDSQFMRPLCVRIGRLLQRLLQWGYRPITDIDDLVIWDRRSLNSLADHAANAALDCAVDWQRVDHDGLKAAKLLQPNWRVCFDGVLRGEAMAALLPAWL